jgi:ABC-type transport system involved in multi-copper enzyme maturation permease subunit
MNQFCAILRDTWRLLTARKLFWLALVITFLIGVLYGSLGYTDTGYSILFVLEINDPDTARGTAGAAATSFDAFYAVTKWWTTLFGVILALVMTASIFPEFMTVGSIDTLLSKPISRRRLFLWKFVSGLIFAAVQCGLLAVIVLAAIRWRLGFWHWPVLWSVPLGVVFFSYLFAVCVFLGVWTRSTLAALLLTLLFWAFCGTLAFTESVAAELSQTSAGSLLGRSEKGKQIAGALHQGIRGVRVVLPKTAETKQLVERTVMRQSDRDFLREQEIQQQVRATLDLERMLGRKPPPPEVVRERVIRDFNVVDSLAKSPMYILGTSLGFEAIVLALGAWVFSRRDY